jgi:3-dehydroquinate synthetase
VKEIELLKIIFKDSPDILEPLNEIDKEIERLNNVIEKLEQENTVLKTQVVNKDKYSYGIRMGSDKE